MSNTYRLKDTISKDAFKYGYLFKKDLSIYKTGNAKGNYEPDYSYPAGLA